MRRGCSALILAAGAMVFPVAASAQAVTGSGDLPGTVTSTTDAVIPSTETVTSVVGTVTSAAGDAAGTAGPQGGGVVGAVSDSGAVAGTQSSSSGQSSTAGSARSREGGDTRSRRNSPGRAYDSRFDRLPRRIEVLLERIELGRNVRANLRRLRSLLASRPDREDAVLRAIRAELKDLRRGGLSPSERKKVARLRAAQRDLENEPSSPSSPTSEAPATVVAGREAVEAGSNGADDFRVPAAQKDHVGDEAGASGASRTDPIGSFLGLIPRPGGGDSGSWLDTLLFAMVWAFVVALLAFMGREVLRALRAG
jgi:hypothetical protein